MICPKCRSEYRSGFKRCADCDIDLIDELPSPEPEQEYADYEQILETNSPSDVALIKSILDAEEITYYFLGEFAAAYTYHAIPMRLMVLKEQAETAREVLSDLNLSYTFGGQHDRISEEDISQ